VKRNAASSRIPAQRNRRPRHHQPFCPGIVAAPEENGEQQAAGDNRIVFWLRHAATLSQSRKVANEICASIAVAT
jgi:hypothetical protein